MEYQRQETLRFWDDYHADHDHQEWISQPSASVLKIIWDHCCLGLGNTSTCISINVGSSDKTVPSDFYALEIGCGTSSLVKDFKLFVENQSATETTVFACGTDVSPVCIEQIRKRDEHLIQKCSGNNNNSSNNNNNNNTLEYRVLNVVEGDKDQQHQQQSWDLILDKGCLDTFLFRSRCRGKDADYNDLVGKVLDNVHAWLKPSSGRYMFITPRAKLKAARDYAGFSSVERFSLPKEAAAPIEGLAPHDLKKSQMQTGYLFVCTRNDNYVSGKSQRFRRVTHELPNDDTVCSSCGVTFLQLRNGEVLDGKDATYWIRQWKGHCTHCKG